MDIDLVSWTQSIISQETNHFLPIADLRQSISEIKELPPFPATANRILQLASDPLADARKLAEIIELDPLLATQVIRWASSALYGYRGNISSVQDAITSVLGFDFVLNLALGLATLAPLNAPKLGIIGTKALMLQSLASTRLMILIAQQMPEQHRPPAQQLFLAGLMHNIGFLLLGHQFTEQHAYLTRLIEANPSLGTSTIENFTFGYNHSQLGAWLMQTWSMPKPIIDIVFHHHNPNYRGENYQLNLLVYLNDYLLGKMAIGDAINQLCPAAVYEDLGITETDCMLLIDNFNQEIDDIKGTVENLFSS